MKPNFAVSLSFDGIGLLHRTHPGWHLVGEVALSHEDLSGELARLADMARALDPKGIRSKLVIPSDQIKYLAFETDSRDPDIIEAQVRNAIDGATPYAVSELAYDWTASAGEVYVAAVALETLWEAEAFAVEHGFEPLSFVAIPEAGAFEGEPFFGQTRHAQTVLGAGAQVERDLEAVRIVGKAKLPQPPKPKPEAAPKPEPKPEAKADAPKPAPAPEGKQKPADAPKPEAPKDQPRGEAQGAPDPATPDKVSKPEEAKPEAPTAAPVAFSSTRARPGGDAPKPDTKPVEMPKARFGAAADAAKPEGAARSDAAPKAPPAPPTSKDSAPKPAAPKPAAQKPAAQKPVSQKPTAPAAPKPAPGPSRDAGADVAPAPGFIAAKSPTAPERATAPAARSAPASDATTGKSKLSPADASKMAKTLGASLLGAMSKAKSAAKAIKPKPKPAAPEPRLEDALKSTPAASATPPSPATLSPGAQGRSLQPKLDDAALDEAQRMTVFGARSPAAPRRQSPRYLALILTAVLLLFLVAVAAWAAIFLDDGVAGLWRKDAETVQVAEETEPPPSVPAAPGADTGSTNAEEAQDTVAALTDPEAAPDPTAAETQDTAPDATLVPEVLPTPIPEQLSADEARARYAATGIWQVAPDAPTAPGTNPLEDPYHTTLDPEPGFADAVALPDSNDLVADARPPTPSAPPLPGQDFERDERGFILATPDGTEGPEGVIIYTGRPPIIPPPTPQRAEPEALDSPALAAPDEPTLRPRLRPEDLSDLFERSSNGGRTLAELQTFRPRARPLNPQQVATAEANAAALADGADFENDPFAGATEAAIAVSLKPRPRPANFAQIAAAAQAAAAAEPVSVVQRVEPSIPTQASVARAATDKNQISLRKVNLIGVYGKPGSRRALVRLANGSYRKVEVGDRLDGGQVAAIGESELSYVKRGNAVTLKMPRG